VILTILSPTLLSRIPYLANNAIQDKSLVLIKRIAVNKRKCNTEKKERKKKHR